MEPATPRSPQEQPRPDDEQEDTQKLPVPRAKSKTGTLEKAPPPATDIVALQPPGDVVTDKETEAIPNITDSSNGPQSNIQQASSDHADPITDQVFPPKLDHQNGSPPQRIAIEAIDTVTTRSMAKERAATALSISTRREQLSLHKNTLRTIDTQQILGSVREAVDIQKAVAVRVAERTLPETPTLPLPKLPQATVMPTKQALLLISLLCILLLHALNVGPELFSGSQGWASVLGGPVSNATPDLLKNVNKQLQGNATPGTKKQALTPQQYIDLIVHNMTLDQKLGQMMMVQFTGPDYSPALNTMLAQYNVGAVLLYYSNNNILNKMQLKNLDQQMQQGRTIPLAIAIDQEGGQVDRLLNLDGPRPAASTIGATNDPARARAAGLQDAQDLSSYGINLNLAPVVDVTSVFNPQLYMRTYGKDPALVTKMAAAYLQGLQQSGQVIGTLKHFPGLGDVSGDPHIGVPRLTRSRSGLEQIDWAPYRNLIRQGNVHAIMVTHEIVTALDNTVPSSLSSKIVQGILRDELGFQGVIMTDSLTMQGVTDYYTPSQAAALAVEAGADLLMGARSPSELTTMIEGIKQAIASGAISQQRIDDSVRRILLMKYAMGLLPIPQQ
ncbi:MAG TPA: glycoside hydrolase family 3 protein [Ktedonosporobacter sp.]|jgi:beta-N-acetylhexosaminidase|nr:glycoside hydrolase family 3 protein [Ktedonosporobacter sp.]